MSVVAKEAADTQTKPTRLKMSYEAYLEWAGEDMHAKWVNGEAIVFMLPKYVHQTTLKFLLRLLGLFADTFKLGKVQVAPFEMRLPRSNSYREPDLLFVATKNLDRFTENRLDGPADLMAGR